MSFEIFASGSGGFHKPLKEFPDQGDFERIEVFQELSKVKLKKKEVIEAVAEKVLPSAPAPPSAVEAAGMLSSTVALMKLSDAVDYLAMCAGASSGGSITVSTKESKLLWADSTGFAKYNFTPGIEPGIEFIRIILPSLDKTNLNDWAVLWAISRILTEYHSHIDSYATPNILIQIFK